MMSFSRNSAVAFDKPLIMSIPLIRAQWRSVAKVAIAHLPYQDLYRDRENYLHPEEVLDFKSISYPHKKKQFLQGRYVAKLALSSHVSEENLTQFKTRAGIFQQPLATHPYNDLPAFSISHSGSMTACITFAQDHPMGLDIEQLIFGTENSIQESSFTKSELNLARSISEPIEQFHIRLWSIKESLSKTLTTGLMTPLKVYEVSLIENLGSFVVSYFTNFGQYKTISFTAYGCMWAITLPKNTDHKPLVEIYSRLT